MKIEPGKNKKILDLSIDEATASDEQLAKRYLNSDPERYVDLMKGRYDGSPMPKGFPRKTDNDGYRTEASPAEFARLAYKMEMHRQMHGEPKKTIKKTPNQIKKENFEKTKKKVVDSKPKPNPNILPFQHKPGTPLYEWWEDKKPDPAEEAALRLQELKFKEVLKKVEEGKMARGLESLLRVKRGQI